MPRRANRPARDRAGSVAAWSRGSRSFRGWEIRDIRGQPGAVGCACRRCSPRSWEAYSEVFLGCTWKRMAAAAPGLGELSIVDLRGKTLVRIHAYVVPRDVRWRAQYCGLPALVTTCSGRHPHALLVGPAIQQVAAAGRFHQLLAPLDHDMAAAAADQPALL